MLLALSANFLNLILGNQKKKKGSNAFPNDI